MSTLRNNEGVPSDQGGDRTPYPTAVPEPARTSHGRAWRVVHFSEIDSTNRFLVDEARAGADGNLVAVADHQTAGRGRFDRRWEAPPGSSLLVSVLLRPVHDVADAHRAVMGASVALLDAVESVAGVAAALKWPNDVVVGDRKLAGVLAEREGDALVVGLGCNVHWDAFPDDLADTATACNLESGRLVDRDALLDAFLDSLAALLDRPDEIVSRYRAALATLHRRVRVERAHDTVTGDAVEVTGDGALLVRRDDGTEETVIAGDVVHLR
jgi:BirA family transcriptional regulator, biotin operon repressor / biotin---[acetyl-CoA-carboxylase] ligase